MTELRIKRAYEHKKQADGFRVLVDRLWPRGLKKEDAHFDAWMKEVAPSNVLRNWFNHNPKKWTEFRTRYKAELKGSKQLEELLDHLKNHKTVTLIYAAKDEEHNNALVLKEFLEAMQEQNGLA